MDPFFPLQYEAVSLFQSHFGLTRPRSDVDYLRQILRRYSQIPYENISKIIKVAKNPALEGKFRLPLEVIEDHIEHRLGGTCFSLTYLLEQILLASGYTCHKAMAHMQAGINIHCVMVVESSGDRYLVDPGYLLWEPLPLHPRHPVVCHTPRGGVELQHDPDLNQYNLFTFDVRGRKWRYRFQDQAVSEEEFRGHWIASFSRPTLHQILLNRLTEKGQCYVRGNHLRLTSLREERKSNIRQDCHQQIHHLFGIDPGWVEEALSILKQQREGWARQKGSVRG